MTPQSSKAKGRNLQKLVRDKILESFPTLTADDVRSTSMGSSGEDIQLSPEARKLVPYSIECKSKATSQLHTYYKQAKSNSGTHIPMVVVKKDRDVVLVAVEFQHFLDLLQKVQEPDVTRS